MKKSLFFGLIAILGLIGCSRNQEIVIPDSNLSLFARTESPADTKTVVESGVHVFWEPGDEIAVFMGEKSAKFTTDITAASGTATFKGTFGDSSWPEDLDLWAVYPFSEDATFDGETITTTLPSEQVAREGSFGKDMNLSVAHSNTSTLQFYNVGGGIRFSVTEAGVKKVMFEGLSGEIISGKVKIGFENGLPKVQEVSGGSQFITLLPPSGKETFEKDTWYYIVAIPETLEGGYKLRFYKDDDYARKISEKAVTIKRSIFGNIENADHGIDYNDITSHYPSTDAQWQASFELMHSIAQSYQSIWTDQTDESVDVDEIAQELLRIDGVATAEPNPSGNAIVIMQNDSVYVNVILDQDILQSVDTEYNSDESTNLKKNTSGIHYTKRSASIPYGKRALLISPYQNKRHQIELGNKSGFNVDTDFFKEALELAGFSLEVIVDDEVTLDHFQGDYLNQFDVIIIYTHGDSKLKTVSGKTSTALLSGIAIPLSAHFTPEGNEAFAISHSAITTSYVITVPWLEATTHSCYNNSIVLIAACSSYDDSDLHDYFLDSGAAAFGGFRREVAVGLTKAFGYDLIINLVSGLDFVKSSTYAFTGLFVPNTSESLINDYGYSDLYRLDSYRFSNTPDVYLYTPGAYDLNSIVTGESVHLTWKRGTSEKEDSAVFSVYIDDSYIGSTLDRSYDLKLPAGKYRWTIRTSIVRDEDIRADYYCEGEPFIVSGASDEQVLTSRTYNGKTYSIIRKNVSSTDCRINGDGSKFYACSYSVKVGGETYNLPGSFYSYTDRNFRDTGPVMAVNTQTGKTYVFLIEKDTDETYGMCGYVFTLSSGSISQQTVFTYANFGWFPYFEWYEGQFLLNMFSYAGYFSIIAPQDEDWALYYNEDIYPDDFLVLQQQHDLICIH